MGEGKIGKMEKWKDGSNGRMEDWKDGKVELANSDISVNSVLRIAVRLISPLISFCLPSIALLFVAQPFMAGMITINKAYKRAFMPLCIIDPCYFF